MDDFSMSSPLLQINYGIPSFPSPDLFSSLCLISKKHLCTRKKGKPFLRRRHLKNNDNKILSVTD